MKYRLTVVEDNAADLFLLKDVLGRIGISFEIDSFSDGEKARTYIQQGEAPRPDLFLFDLNLPFIGGLELLQLLSHEPRFAGLPVLVWSSAQSNQDLAAIAEFPAVEFIPKPMDLGGFLQIGHKIHEMLQYR